MDDLEAKMAEALRGKFFMDPTYEHFGVPNPLQLEILRLQRTFVDKPPKKMPKEMPKKPQNSGFSFDYLLDVICSVHGVDKAEIIRNSRKKDAMIAKHHYRWSIVRYFPALSAAEIGRRLGHDHSTVLHSCNEFKKMLDKHKEHVMVVDKAMEYK